MLPGDRLICAFVEPHEVHEQFKTWYLHVTVMPWFRVADATEALVPGLERALTKVAPFTAILQTTAWFGPQKNREAFIVQLPSPFTDIESKVRTFFHKKRAWLVDETTTRRHAFRPHVTVQPDSRMTIHDSFTCDRLYIVEQKGTYKEVVGMVRLQHGKNTTRSEVG